MKKKRKPGYYTVMTLAFLFALGTVLTVLPLSYTYKECLLGYKAHCTFTPVSTVMCLIGAAVTFYVGRSEFTEVSS